MATAKPQQTSLDPGITGFTSDFDALALNGGGSQDNQQSQANQLSVIDDAQANQRARSHGSPRRPGLCLTPELLGLTAMKRGVSESPTRYIQRIPCVALSLSEPVPKPEVLNYVHESRRLFDNHWNRSNSDGELNCFFLPDTRLEDTRAPPNSWLFNINTSEERFASCNHFFMYLGDGLNEETGLIIRPSAVILLNACLRRMDQSYIDVNAFITDTKNRGTSTGQVLRLLQPAKFEDGILNASFEGMKGHGKSVILIQLVVLLAHSKLKCFGCYIRDMLNSTEIGLAQIVYVKIHPPFNCSRVYFSKFRGHHVFIIRKWCKTCIPNNPKKKKK